jgi:hypothetical protein
MRPETVWPVDAEYADDYARDVAVGRRVASELDVVVVSIARNAMPLINNTAGLLAEARRGFRSLRWFVFENDSEDGTNDYLDRAAERHGWIQVRHETLGGLDSRGFEPERTERLAYCRNACHDWVREHAAGATWTIVLDVDPQHGFSPDGIFHSICQLGAMSARSAVKSPGAMASYSLYRDESGVAHYDAWAMRLNWWRDRRKEIGFGWASGLLPPVGSPPIPMNSAFGGLCVYKTEAFLAAGVRPYEGGDCEHVFLHKKMADAGYQLYLNPGCRYISIWQ